MVLAVDCNNATGDRFTELGLPSEPCITQAKSTSLQTRLQQENAAKMKRIERLLARLENGEITPEQYEKILAVYSQLSFTEDISLSPPSGKLSITILDEQGKPKTITPLGDKPLISGLSDTEIDRIEREVIQQEPKKTPPK